MAIGVGQIILSSDMRSWYTRLNTIISNYGPSLGTLTVPNAGKIAEASDVNNVVYKLNSMKSDAYLGYDQSLYTAYSTVSVGQIITATTGTQLNTVITNLERIKCRNDATKANGNTNNLNGHQWSQGANSHQWSQGANSHQWSQGAHGNGWNQGAHGNGWSQGTNGNGWSESVNYNGCSNSPNGHENSRSYCSNGLKTHGGCYNGNECAYWSNSGTNSNGCSQGTNGNGWSDSINYNGCSQGVNSHNWSQGVWSNVWNQGAHGNGWSQGYHGNGWNQGAHGNGWTNWVNSQGTQKDIFHARAYV